MRFLSDMPRHRLCASLMLFGLAILLAACGADDPAPPTATPTAAPPEAMILVERAGVFPAPDRDATPFTYLFERERVAIEGQSEDGTFLQVTVEGRAGWILRAQVEVSGDLAQVAVASAPEGDAATEPVPVAPPSPTPTAATSPTPPASPATLETAEPDQPATGTPTLPAPVASGPTRTPLPTRTPGGDATLSDMMRPGEPPPLDITLPEGWQAAHLLVPFSTVGGQREMPLTIYTGPLGDGVTGIIYLFWRFPSIVAPNGELNLWADGVQILRGSLIGTACNLGVYEQQTLTVGGQSGVGAFYQADACEDQTDTAGWFVTVRPANISFAFYTAVEPLEAMPDHVAALQAILDSVRFHAP